MTRKQTQQQLEKNLENLVEIINLEAIQQLPKATEHFISDLHGEFEAFDHILRNCSGVISLKVKDLFDGILSEEQQQELCFYIYYPEDLLANLEKTNQEWYKLLDELVQLTRFVSTKYTRSKVRKALPKYFAYILEELLYKYDETENKEQYYNSIYVTIVDLNLANDFAIVLANLIQRFVVDHLHVLGDIYDRGPDPDKIMDRLMEVPSLDIQLGNHDLIWIGAFSGSIPCLCNVLRITLRYGHTALMEKYGIDLARLAKYGERYYDDNKAFRPRGDNEELTEEEILDITRMHQAISIMQFKVEGETIKRRPEFKMEDRLLFSKLSENRQTLIIDGKEYPLSNTCFQKVYEEDPYELTLGEELVLRDLLHQFQTSEKLQRHIAFLVNEGTLYQTYNGNLLFHGCIPCDQNGEFLEITLEGQQYSGRALMDYFANCIHKAYDDPNTHDDFATDVVWYLWCGEASNLFGKKTMKTFERYFSDDKELHHEAKNPYYELRNQEAFCIKLLNEFGLSDEGYIINGHTPVKTLKGELPIKANGKMLVIDGGLAKPYQKETGIAGYTLVDNSHETYLVAHHAFTTKEDAIANYRDILPTKEVVTKRSRRAQVLHTDIGSSLVQQANRLRYASGFGDRPSVEG